MEKVILAEYDRELARGTPPASAAAAAVDPRTRLVVEGRACPRQSRSWSSFPGIPNKPLVKDICEYLEIPIGSCEVGKFSDGEIQIEIAENVRGRDVFLVPEHLHPGERSPDGVADHDRRRPPGLGGSITAVVPYFGYARQDRRWLLERRSRPAWSADLIDLGGRRPLRFDGPARRADPGVFRHALGPPVRLAHPPRGHEAQVRLRPDEWWW